MHWVTKQVEANETEAIRRLLADQAAAFGNGHSLMLVGVREEGGTHRLWVGATDAALLESYAGFTPCRGSNLPLAPTLITGPRDLFERTFHGP